VLTSLRNPETPMPGRLHLALIVTAHLLCMTLLVALSV